MFVEPSFIIVNDARPIIGRKKALFDALSCFAIQPAFWIEFGEDLFEIGDRFVTSIQFEFYACPIKFCGELLELILLNLG